MHKAPAIAPHIDDVQALTLNNEHLGVELECLPEYGGRINFISLNNGRETMNIIQGFGSKEDLVDDTYYRNVLLFPFPNRLDGGAWKYEGRELHFPVNEPDRGNALHGFLHRKALDVRSHRNDEHGIEVVLGYRYRKEYDYYPFELDVQVTYRIERPDTFSLEFEITNAGQEKAPVGFGWHPYFSFGEDVALLELNTPPLREIAVNRRMLPTGQVKPFNRFEHGRLIEGSYFDTCFELQGNRSTTLSSSRRHATISIRQDEVFRYLQLFIPPTRQSIAVEPVTSNINAFQTGEGLTHLAPDQKINGNISVSLNSKD